MKKACAFSHFFFLVLGFFLLGSATACAWEETLGPVNQSNFPPPLSCKVAFEFGWSELPAGRAEAVFEVGAERYVVEGKGGTTGLVRQLWKLDAANWSEGLLRNYQPVYVWQLEEYARHRIELKEIFGPGWVERQRQRWPSDEIAKWKRYEAPMVRDLVGAMMFIRSQELYDGQRIRLVCFPGDDLFLVDVMVEGREVLLLNGVQFPAIRFNLSLQKIGSKGEEKGQLLPHSKFRSGRVWVSDDSLRMGLRAELSVFVGYVYGEIKAFESEARVPEWWMAFSRR